jgi:hypothetical protein
LQRARSPLRTPGSSPTFWLVLAVAFACWSIGALMVQALNARQQPRLSLLARVVSTLLNFGFDASLPALRRACLAPPRRRLHPHDGIFTTLVPGGSASAGPAAACAFPPASEGCRGGGAASCSPSTPARPSRRCLASSAPPEDRPAPARWHSNRRNLLSRFGYAGLDRGGFSISIVIKQDNG